MREQASLLVAGRYELGDVVGQGGYGTVHRGVDRKTGHAVALKMLSPEAGRDRDVVERMLREQQALVALTGTCAVTAIDLCRLESGAPCLVMEWLEGHDLEQQLSDWESAGVRGSTRLLLDLLKPISETLEQAHRIGIVHRDIKPANIFVTDGPVPGARLLDFGLSRLSSAAPLTEVGMVMGSPSYIAPETWRGHSATLDGRADLYSLAVIVFRWLTGRLPFEAHDLVGKMLAATTGARPSAVALRPQLPAGVDAWVVRGLAVEPAERFQTGRDFYAALVAVLDGKPLPAARPPSRGMPSLQENMQTGKRAITTAWKAAASLLKRFTAGRDSAPELQAPPVATAAVDDEPSAPTSRNTMWLDSVELEPVASAKVVSRAPPPPKRAKPASEPRPKSQPRASVAPLEQPKPQSKGQKKRAKDKKNKKNKKRKGKR